MKINSKKDNAGRALAAKKPSIAALKIVWINHDEGRIPGALN
jgi:hypothetical protein